MIFLRIFKLIFTVSTERIIFKKISRRYRIPIFELWVWNQQVVTRFPANEYKIITRSHNKKGAIIQVARGLLLLQLHKFSSRASARENKREIDPEVRQPVALLSTCCDGSRNPWASYLRRQKLGVAWSRVLPKFSSYKSSERVGGGDFLRSTKFLWECVLRLQGTESTPRHQLNWNEWINKR